MKKPLQHYSRLFCKMSFYALRYRLLTRIIKKGLWTTSHSKDLQGLVPYATQHIGRVHNSLFCLHGLVEANTFDLLE